MERVVEVEEVEMGEDPKMDLPSTPKTLGQTSNLSLSSRAKARIKEQGSTF